MHPEVRNVGAGACPLCGMALEPMQPTAEVLAHTESADLRWRFIVSAVLSLPLMVMAMGGHAGMMHDAWVQGLLATPVVLWGGWPFFVRGWASVKARHLNMFTLIALGTGVSYGYSVLALVQGWEHSYFESAAVITTLMLLGQLLELKAREQTGQAIRALLRLAPKTARRIEADGAELDVPVSDIKKGHYLRVRPGESVAVDGIIIEGESAVDQSMITGESMPVARLVGDVVIGGTMNLQGSFIMRAEHVGDATMLARIAALVASAQRSKAPIQQLADRVSGVFVPVVLAIAVLTFFAWGMWGEGMSEAVGYAVAVLIIACPCALGLATPMAVVCGAGRGARAGVLVRQAEAIERLAGADVLVLDKTGTLTQGAPKLLLIAPTEGHSEPNLLRLAASLEQHSEHPLSNAIVQEAKIRGLGLLKVHAFNSITGKGISGIVDGRSVAIGSEAMLTALGIPASLKTKAKPYQSQGQTVVFVAMDGHCIGMLMLADPVKQEAGEVLKLLSGLKLVMMTGDSVATAIAVGRKLGINDVRAEASPQSKSEMIMALQAAGKKVAMAGDGVNDAPALMQADVGIAMGTGTDVAMESAGITLVSGDLMGLVRARRLSEAVMNVIRQNLVFAFGYNILAIPVAAGVFSHWGIYLSPVVASGAMAASSLCVIINSLRLRNVAL